MKKLVFVATLWTLVWTMARGQGNFRFGVQASPTFSWLSTDNKHIQGNGSNLGFKFGVMGEYDFGENYSFFGGLNFAFHHGGTLKYDNPGNYWPSVIDTVLAAGTNLKYNIQMVEIPFGMKMRTNEFGYLRFFAELPTLSIGILTKATGDIVSQQDKIEDEDISKELKALALSWGASLGVEYEISSTTRLIGGLSYQKYFLDLTEDSQTDDYKTTMSGLVIKIGVLF